MELLPAVNRVSYCAAHNDDDGPHGQTVLYKNYL